MDTPFSPQKQEHPDTRGHTGDLVPHGCVRRSWLALGPPLVDEDAGITVHLGAVAPVHLALGELDEDVAAGVLDPLTDGAELLGLVERRGRDPAVEADPPLVRGVVELDLETVAAVHGRTPVQAFPVPHLRGNVEKRGVGVAAVGVQLEGQAVRVGDVGQGPDIQVGTEVLRGAGDDCRKKKEQMASRPCKTNSSPWSLVDRIT